jgi:hypothetical protein
MRPKHRLACLGVFILIIRPVGACELVHTTQIFSHVSQSPRPRGGSARCGIFLRVTGVLSQSSAERKRTTSTTTTGEGSTSAALGRVTISNFRKF